MSASSSTEDEVYEYRLLIATAGALVLSAVGLVTAMLVLTTGDRFAFRPAAPEVASAGDNVAAQGAPPAAASDKPQGEQNRCAGSQSWPYSGKDCPFSAHAPAKRRIVVRLKSPWCTGVLRHQPFRACRPRPK